MANKKEVVVSSPATEEEGKTELYYEFTAEQGDVHVHISVGRYSEVKVMSGEPANPPRPPRP